MTTQNSNDSASVAATMSLASLIVQADYQVRASTSQSAIDDYRDAIIAADGFPFPPIKVVGNYCVDGFHRIAAVKAVRADPATTPALRIKLASVPVVKLPTSDDCTDVREVALREALGSNHSHGVRLTRKDKRRMIELASERWPDASDREIGRMVGVTHNTVAKVRRPRPKPTYQTVDHDGLREDLRSTLLALPVGGGLVLHDWHRFVAMEGEMLIQRRESDYRLTCHEIWGKSEHGIASYREGDDASECADSVVYFVPGSHNASIEMFDLADDNEQLDEIMEFRKSLWETLPVRGQPRVA